MSDKTTYEDMSEENSFIKKEPTPEENEERYEFIYNPWLLSFVLRLIGYVRTDYIGV